MFSLCLSVCVFEGSESFSWLSSSWRRKERHAPRPLLGSTNGYIGWLVGLQHQVASLSAVTETVNYRTNSSPGYLRQRHYSSAETSFANSWVSTAEYVAAAHFQSSLENSGMFIKNLPGRVLKASTPSSTCECITLLRPNLLIFSFCLLRRSRMIELQTSLTWVRRRTTLWVSSPGCQLSTASWVIQPSAPLPSCFRIKSGGFAG